MLNNELKNAINAAAVAAGVSVSFNDADDSIAARVGDNAAVVITRYIDDVKGDFACRIIKPKKASEQLQVVFCNIPSVADIAARGGVCYDFAQKYFSSAYVRKLLSLPNITKIEELLTPQSGAGFVADFRTKAFNAMAKILVVALKAKLPSKSKLISEKAIKTFIAESDLTDLTLGQVQVKEKRVNVSDYIRAIVKAKIAAVNAETESNLTVDDIYSFAVESLQKENSKAVESAIDEDSLDI